MKKAIQYTGFNAEKIIKFLSDNLKQYYEYKFDDEKKIFFLKTGKQNISLPKSCWLVLNTKQDISFFEDDYFEEQIKIDIVN